MSNLFQLLFYQLTVQLTCQLLQKFIAPFNHLSIFIFLRRSYSNCDKNKQLCVYQIFIWTFKHVRKNKEGSDYILNANTAFSKDCVPIFLSSCTFPSDLLVGSLCTIYLQQLLLIEPSADSYSRFILNKNTLALKLFLLTQFCSYFITGAMYIFGGIGRFEMYCILGLQECTQRQLKTSGMSRELQI